MEENLRIPVDADRRAVYEALLPQIRSLTEGEPDFIANVSNIIAALKEGLNFFWIGLYFVKKNELVLGPFQGPVACTRIQKGKGVCGSAWESKQTLIVPDVDAFPGHIACSALSRSEIAVPIYSTENKILGVLDIDSIFRNDFDETDRLYLEQVTALIAALPRE
ncbi:MAG: GAF domain-containing protein [Crocinitomicaceae bacterium]|nr:GAF domain-containing protein [Crocinitomicaceae bacterium]